MYLSYILKNIVFWTWRGRISWAGIPNKEAERRQTLARETMYPPGKQDTIVSPT